ncbi:MAG: YceI family protein [Hyphomonas sp.]|nr:YceI family protein [Hyphomonas sp.]
MRHLILPVSALFLVACSEAAPTAAAPEAPAAETADAAPPEAEVPAAAQESEAPAAAEAPAPVEIDYPEAGRYQVDPNHAAITWSVNHLGLSDYEVGFNTFTIDLTLDPENPAQSAVNVSIDPKSVNPNYPGDYQVSHPSTGFTTWKDDLGQSNNWFNANAFPEITFASTEVDQTGPDTAKVTGDLTLLGVTKPVTLDVKYNGVVNFPNAPEMDRIGFSASTMIKRSDFGMTAMQAFVGDDVSIRIEAELNEVME